MGVRNFFMRQMELMGVISIYGKGRRDVPAFGASASPTPDRRDQKGALFFVCAFLSFLLYVRLCNAIDRVSLYIF